MTTYPNPNYDISPTGRKRYTCPLCGTPQLDAGGYACSYCSWDDVRLLPSDDRIRRVGQGSIPRDRIWHEVEVRGGGNPEHRWIVLIDRHWLGHEYETEDEATRVAKALERENKERWAMLAMLREANQRVVTEVEDPVGYVLAAWSTGVRPRRLADAIAEIEAATAAETG